MNQIFLSYRREDSADVSGRINDRLAQHFGQDSIFTDVDSIPLGIDFQQYIDEQVGKCDIFLAVIGRDWLSVTDIDGCPRLQQPRDFVRIEVESALRRNIPVIPLLVRRATMPSGADLPDTLNELTTRNGMPIRPNPDFHRDMERLINGIEQHLSRQSEVATKRETEERTAKEREERQNLEAEAKRKSKQEAKRKAEVEQQGPEEERIEREKSAEAKRQADVFAVREYEKIVRTGHTADQCIECGYLMMDRVSFWPVVVTPFLSGVAVLFGELSGIEMLVNIGFFGILAAFVVAGRYVTIHRIDCPHCGASPRQHLNHSSQAGR